MICVSGTMANNTAGAFTLALMAYGTGTAPINGATTGGTSLGSTLKGHSSAANYALPFTLCNIITGLTLNTAIWADLVVAVSSGTGTVTSVSWSIMEF
jgi:hypothetical protein